MRTTLRLTDEQHTSIKAHVLPQDGKEAVALALCGRRAGSQQHHLLVHRVVLVPYDDCSIREPNRVCWPTDLLIPLLEEASRRGMAILKIHGHPQNYPHHSDVDDRADRELFPSIHGWMEDDYPHASAIMLPNGRIVGRVVHPDGRFEPLASVQVVGNDLQFYDADEGLLTIPSAAKRTVQTFGEETFAKLSRRKIAVVGCSGTGSWVVEQLGRYGVKALVLVDPDYVDEVNLNRIPATKMDAEEKLPKVMLMKRLVESMGFGTQVETHTASLFDPDVVKAVADCDLVFGCIDTIDGRWLLNRLATFYLLPYFDMGVKLTADRVGGVEQASAGVQYLFPGQSLWNRGMFSLEQVRAAGEKRVNPEGYKRQRADKYMEGLPEDERPAVISFNMFIASLAILEFRARLHPYRDDPNSEYSSAIFSFSQMRLCTDTHTELCPTLAKHIGRGDITPLLENPELSIKEMSLV
jgi:hypothetical protein